MLLTAEIYTNDMIKVGISLYDFSSRNKWKVYLINLKKDLGQEEKVQVGLEVYHFFRKTFPNLFPSPKRFVQVMSLQKFEYLQIVNVTEVNIFGTEFPTIFLHLLN